MNRLQNLLQQIDRTGYKQYKRIKGQFSFEQFLLFIDHVQADPFASPTRTRVRVRQKDAGFPPHLYSNPVRALAFADFLARVFQQAIKMHVPGEVGPGLAGGFFIDAGGQQVLPRTAVKVTPTAIEVRFHMGLCAAGKKVDAKGTGVMLFQQLPRVVRDSLFYDRIVPQDLETFVDTVEDHHLLQQKLQEQGLVAFLEEGALLAREPGQSDRPLKNGRPLQVPKEMATTIELPRKAVTGLGLPEGVTLIAGGSFQGKSTLLSAIAKAVYPHIPGDGREGCCTRADAVFISSEAGRYVSNVNLTPFVQPAAGVEGAGAYTTESASSLTSQVAGIMEMLEMGARTLLFDEDASAMTLMLRDPLVEKLIPREKEVVTPLALRIQDLWEKEKVSSVVAAGSTSAFFPTAHKVIWMENFCPQQQTQDLRKLAKGELRAKLPAFQLPAKGRVPMPDGLEQAFAEKNRIKVKGKMLYLGDARVDISALAQIVDASQLYGIGRVWQYAIQKGMVDGKTPMRDIIARIDKTLDDEGIESLSEYDHPGDYARPRIYEIAATLNRMRTTDFLTS